MKLTRRDALKALAVGGGAAGGSFALSEMLVSTESADTDGGYSDADIDTLYRVAEVVYPSSVEFTSGFIETYVRGLDDSRQAALSRTATQLDDVTKGRYGTSFTEESSVSRSETMLRSLGVHRVQSRPDGNLPERVRYHLVNTLLYVLFTSPTGSKLAGINSPVGHPGGFARYREESEGDN